VNSLLGGGWWKEWGDPVKLVCDLQQCTSSAASHCLGYLYLWKWKGYEQHFSYLRRRLTLPTAQDCLGRKVEGEQHNTTQHSTALSHSPTGHSARVVSCVLYCKQLQVGMGPAKTLSPRFFIPLPCFCLLIFFFVLPPPIHPLLSPLSSYPGISSI
jgi:hypothetical protein